jgi:hypothetical protein
MSIRTLRDVSAFIATLNPADERSQQHRPNMNMQDLAFSALTPDKGKSPS